MSSAESSDASGSDVEVDTSESKRRNSSRQSERPKHPLLSRADNIPSADQLLIIYDYICTYNNDLATVKTDIEDRLTELPLTAEQLAQLKHSDMRWKLNFFLQSIPEDAALNDHLADAFAELKVLCEAIHQLEIYHSIRLLLITEACIHLSDMPDEFRLCLDLWFKDTHAAVKKSASKAEKAQHQLYQQRHKELLEFQQQNNSGDPKQQKQAKEFKLLNTRRNNPLVWSQLLLSFLEELDGEMELSTPSLLEQLQRKASQAAAAAPAATESAPASPARSTRSQSAQSSPASARSAASSRTKSPASARQRRNGPTRVAAAEPVVNESSSEDDTALDRVKQAKAKKVAAEKQRAQARHRIKADTSSSSKRRHDEPLSESSAHEEEDDDEEQQPITQARSPIRHTNRRRKAVSESEPEEEETEPAVKQEQAEDDDEQMERDERKDISEDSESETDKVFGEADTYATKRKRKAAATTSISSRNGAGRGKYDREQANAEKLKFDDGGDSEISIEDTRGRPKKYKASKGSTVIRKRIGMTSFGAAAATGIVHHRAVRKGVGERRPWTTAEEDKLEEVFGEYGLLKNKWSSILRDHGDFFEGRTSQDLKDKHRNMMKKGRSKTAATSSSSSKGAKRQKLSLKKAGEDMLDDVEEEEQGNEEQEEQVEEDEED